MDKKGAVGFLKRILQPLPYFNFYRRQRPIIALSSAPTIALDPHEPIGMTNYQHSRRSRTLGRPQSIRLIPAKAVVVLLMFHVNIKKALDV
jgi:hypothetical protein